MAAADGSALPFWQAGYGYVDLSAAATLVRGKTWSKNLPKASYAVAVPIGTTHVKVTLSHPSPAVVGSMARAIR